MNLLLFIGLIVTGAIAIAFGQMIYVGFGQWLGRTP